MFCPSCGSEERQASQFCRACGVDLRAVRVSLERPDSITASAVSARDEIGRAVADQIRAVGNVEDLKSVAEDVLPEIEQFLESPEEKRLRRLRTGVIVAASGLGACILGLIMSAVLPGPDGERTLILAGLGIAAFAIGLGFVINGLLFTRPRKALVDQSADARSQKALDAGYAPPQLRSNPDAQLSVRAQTTSSLSQLSGSSITEHTTKHLNTDSK